MNSEITRLQTFCNWPASAPVDPSRIAKAGFYYTGTELEVQCFSCHGKINNWDYGDQVMWRHRQLKPNCPFVLDPMNSGNIPNMDMFECNNADEPAHWHVEESLNDEDSGPGDYGVTEEDEIYRSDPLRLLSFINWDDATISREALVNAGFYHAGDGRLRCAWCGGELTTYLRRNIDSLENLANIHRMFFPRCDHAATVEEAQSSNSNIISQPSSPSPATPPIRSPEINESAILSSGAAHNSRILNAGNTWRALGVISSGARHPNQASLTTRLATFDRWPADKTQLPRSMAEAGFFLTGADDQVRCFYCDGGLGRWEDGDEPWSEHARWFPTCGYVLLVKGPEYVEQCRDRSNDQRSVQAPNNNGGNRRNPGNNFPVTESQIEECMESPIALGALCAGLDAARVRRALVRRLQNTGAAFTSSEALIDAVLDDQLSEEPWSVNTQRVATHRFAHDILAETLRELGVPDQRGIADSTTSESDRTRTPSPLPPVLINRVPRINLNQVQPTNERQTTSQSDQSEVRQKRESESEGRDSSTSEARDISLEEENRQLKEARLCKVCMDSEVSVVFLPCGHLVSCARCGAALAACPLCRSPVKALVRAYLA